MCKFNASGSDTGGQTRATMAMLREAHEANGGKCLPSCDPDDFWHKQIRSEDEPLTPAQLSEIREEMNDREYPEGG